MSVTEVKKKWFNKASPLDGRWTTLPLALPRTIRVTQVFEDIKELVMGGQGFGRNLQNFFHS